MGPMNQFTAPQINSHLDDGGLFRVSTYTMSTVYGKRNAGQFIDKDGCLFVKRGNKYEKLTIQGTPIVGLSYGRYKK